MYSIRMQHTVVYVKTYSKGRRVFSEENEEVNEERNADCLDRR